jgi:hypothetical protein
MANEFTNYGTLIASGSVVIGEVTNIEPPEVQNPGVEATNHSSGGWREFIPSGLKELTEFSVTVNYIVSGSALLAKVTAGTVSSYTITFPSTAAWTFNALITGFKPEAADAKSPDVLKAVLTFRPTGVGTLT